VDSSEILPDAIMAAKIKPMKAPMKRPIVMVIISLSFLNLVAWTQTDLGFCSIYMDNILIGHGRNPF
jgi:hypothetical protein